MMNSLSTKSGLSLLLLFVTLIHVVTASVPAKRDPDDLPFAGYDEIELARNDENVQRMVDELKDDIGAFIHIGRVVGKLRAISFRKSKVTGLTYLIKVKVPIELRSMYTPNKREDIYLHVKIQKPYLNGPNEVARIRMADASREIDPF